MILSGVRTAFGTMGGALAKMTTDLAVPTATAALEKAGVSPDDVGRRVRKRPPDRERRHLHGAPHRTALGRLQHVPALISIASALGLPGSRHRPEQILTGQASVVLCGGTESMSSSHVSYDMRSGATSPPPGQDILWSADRLLHRSRWPRQRTSPTSTA